MPDTQLGAMRVSKRIEGEYCMIRTRPHAYFFAGVTAPSISPQSNLVAILTGTNLEIYTTPDLHIHRRFPTSCSAGTAIAWAPLSARSSQRILLQTEDSVHVFDVRDLQWKAILTNGSGGMGKIAAARFSPSGDEILVFSEFGSRMTIWSLDDISDGSVTAPLVPLNLTQHTEIRDPKPFLGNGESCCGFRPTRNTSLVPLFALLTRQGAQDVLSLHAPHTYAVLASSVISSVDAQGLKWSPDGRWIAIWDAPSAGPKVWIYTADGNSYRSWSVSGNHSDDGTEDLGVKCIEWCPKSRYLVIGTYDGKVAVLGTKTVRILQLARLF